MDLLKKEMERKKKALQDAKKSNPASTSGRYIKTGELRRLQEETEEAEREKRKRKTQGRDGKKRSRVEEEHVATKKDAPAVTSEAKAAPKKDNVQAAPVIGDLALFSPAEVTQRFRVLGLPVRLFGECTNTLADKQYDDSARLHRLREALAIETKKLASLSEKDEFRLGSGHAIRNPFLEKDDADSAAVPQEMQEPKDKAPSKKATTETAEDDSSDPHKRIYKYFKGLLSEWEDDLALRSDEVKRSVTGRNETKTLKQCKDYIRPLFKLCKNRRLEEGLTKNLAIIVDFCLQGEFVKAHDTYLDVAIGRAAWPIGVTMVGIHARTGRAKIESQNVAHVMNSELQRKYLTSVKRLMTFAQKKRTDVDPSKKVS